MRGSGFVGAPLNFLGDEALVEVVGGDPSRYEDAVADLQARLVHPRQGPHLTLEAASGLGNQTSQCHGALRDDLTVGLWCDHAMLICPPEYDHKIRALVRWLHFTCTETRVLH